MKKVLCILTLALTAGPALAADPTVPEMSTGAGVAAIALLAGAAAILRERRKK